MPILEYATNDNNISQVVDANHPLPITSTTFADKQEIDQNADGNTYFGWAAPGTATSVPSWRVQRMLVSGNTKTFQYADGNLAYDNVWDNRTTLTYL